ncbi:MAG: DNA-processing protein DprA, partial [Gemmatimonadota bacterium]|nr:DNA-processing protein DprA [Gemmatimonadota bacterium]
MATVSGVPAGGLLVREPRLVPGSIEIVGTDPRFPALLREVDPPPASLFCLGDPSLLAGPAVAIVGSRAATRFGSRIAETLGAGLAAEGVVVVSGLARGIDAAAHAGALSVGGATVGVVAGGLDVGVPHATRPLGRRIAREGCVVTEYEAGTPPVKGRFPQRNRI